jgi:hypothetical protein
MGRGGALMGTAPLLGHINFKSGECREMQEEHRPTSLKEALEMPLTGFDVDLDELIGSRDEPPLPLAIDFSRPEYRE